MAVNSNTQKVKGHNMCCFLDVVCLCYRDDIFCCRKKTCANYTGAMMSDGKTCVDVFMFFFLRVRRPAFFECVWLSCVLSYGVVWGVGQDPESGIRILFGCLNSYVEEGRHTNLLVDTNRV